VAWRAEPVQARQCSDISSNAFLPRLCGSRFRLGTLPCSKRRLDMAGFYTTHHTHPARTRHYPSLRHPYSTPTPSWTFLGRPYLQHVQPAVLNSVGAAPGWRLQRLWHAPTSLPGGHVAVGLGGEPARHLGIPPHIFWVL